MYIIKTFLECLRHITALFAFCQGRRILCLSTLPSFYGELHKVFFSPSVYISRFSFSPLDNLLAILYIQNHMYTAINQTQVSEKERLSINEFDRLGSSQPALRTTMFCTHCGQEISKDAITCPSCGAPQKDTKFCQHCGSMIDNACVVCPKCGKQVAALKSEQPNIIINNSNESTNINHNQVGGYGRPKDKWISFFLCLFLSIFGGHKFYEGKIGAGILYLLTAGLCGVGVLVDLIILLFKPNPYYV